MVTMGNHDHVIEWVFSEKICENTRQSIPLLSEAMVNRPDSSWASSGDVIAYGTSWLSIKTVPQ